MLGLFGIETGWLAIVLASQTWLVKAFVFQSKRWEVIFWSGVIILLIGFLFVVIGWIKKKNFRYDVILPALLNVIVVFSCWGVAEIAIRIISQDDPLGKRVGAITLRPYNWQSFSKFNLGLYNKSLQVDSFYVGHPQLGWAVGDSRKSDDGLYASSKLGLRSKVQGEDLFNTKYKTRIALFGDSFMFSEEVAYEASLHKHMQSHLGNDYQVLSFGVPGYGIDQAVLRYELEGEKWKPDIVVLAFVRDDFNRTLNIYTGFKTTWGIPFSKPRYLKENNDFVIKNIPNMSPVEIYNRDNVFSLPFIQHDVTFSAYDWEAKFLDGSLLFRYLASIYPPWVERSSTTNEESLIETGVYLTKKFANTAMQRQAKYLLVYIPGKSDFYETVPTYKAKILDAIDQGGVEVYDATACLTDELTLDELYVVGGVHYSNEGNFVLANCLLKELALLTND
jgi:uncharacterized protein with PQ loop repeat